MKPILAICLAAAASATLAACAADQTADASGPEDRACFRADDVVDWRAGPSSDTALFEVRRDETWRADLVGLCSDLNYSEQIGLRPQPTSTWICSGDDARLYIPNQISGAGICDARNFQKLSAEEAAASKVEKR